MIKYRKTVSENWFEKVSEDGTISASFTNRGQIGRAMWIDYQIWLDDGNVPDEYVLPTPVPAIDQLRAVRNLMLPETDWWAGSDLTMTQEQKDYRKALRDLPSTASPSLDDYGELTNVTWPTKPE